MNAHIVYNGPAVGSGCIVGVRGNLLAAQILADQELPKGEWGEWRELGRSAFFYPAAVWERHNLTPMPGDWDWPTVQRIELHYSGPR